MPNVFVLSPVGFRALWSSSGKIDFTLIYVGEQSHLHHFLREKSCTILSVSSLLVFLHVDLTPQTD
jgi:hypothetical protein